MLSIKTVLISDAVAPECINLLKENGIEVEYNNKISKDDLVKEIQKYDGLVVRSDTKVTKEVLEAGKRLKVVGRAGAGVDNIDVKTASEKDVLVLNTPGGNSISACEMTCALIMNLARHIPQAAASMRNGKWDRKLYSGHEVSEKTLAIIGLGRIGREVAIRMQAFGMRTIGYDPIVKPEDSKKFNVEQMDLAQIWPQADYITVHTPLIPQTRNMINADVFNACKMNVRIINVARGGIIDEQALLDAINGGKCAGAALDVYEEEPPKSPVTLELIKNPKVICTPHLGASTSEAQVKVAVEIAEQFIALTGTNKKYTEVQGVVNLDVYKKLKGA